MNWTFSKGDKKFKTGYLLGTPITIAVTYLVHKLWVLGDGVFHHFMH